MKVLLIEDDQRLARLIARVLRDEHYQVDVVHDGDTGLEYALRGVYQVAIIDWMLPERDGPSICRAVRAARLPRRCSCLQRAVRSKTRSSVSTAAPTTIW